MSNKNLDINTYRQYIYIHVVGLHARWVGGCSFLWFGCLKKIKPEGNNFLCSDGLVSDGEGMYGPQAGT